MAASSTASAARSTFRSRKPSPERKGNPLGEASEFSGTGPGVYIVATSNKQDAAEAPALGSARCLAKDEPVFAEGDRAAFFYKVVSGAIRTSKLLSDGRRQIDAFHLPGDIFGIESGDEHRFTAEALGSATVIAYRRCGLETLASADAAFSRQIVAAMMRSLERAQDHMLLLG